MIKKKKNGIQKKKKWMAKVMGVGDIEYEGLV